MQYFITIISCIVPQRMGDVDILCLFACSSSILVLAVPGFKKESYLFL